MERRRLQHRKLQEQQRFSVSQQDLTDAIARMKPTLHAFHTQRRSTLENLTNIPSSPSNETFNNRSVSQLIQEFEARQNIIPYASAQDLLLIVNDVLCNEAESNCNHMSIRTMKIKDVSNDNDIINNNVCSAISRSSNDENQMVTEELHRQEFIGDKREEKGDEDDDEEIHHTSDKDRHKHDLSLSLLPRNNNHSTPMLTRSTDIDAAALTLGKRHEIRFDELLLKEAQLNHALADLMALSNDADKSMSVNSSPSFGSDQRATNGQNNNHLSASIDLLNDLLGTFDLRDEDWDSKKEAKQKSINPKTSDHHAKPINMYCLMLSDNVCANCHQSFATNEQIVNAAGHIWHTHCFVCTQCFQPFENGIYFEHESRKYCERDFQMLFTPCCAECKQAIVGRVIRALQKCFHPDCFRCQSCQVSLIDKGFSKYNGRAFCRDCHTKEKAKDLTSMGHICSSCHQMIGHKSLKYKGEFYHPHHFQCSTCRIELDENSREARGSLYCLPCHNKLDLPVCAACRRLIDDRVISALGKQWHVEHFCCARCARPFYGNKYFENKGLAYCESDYQILFRPTCFICNDTITDGTYTVFNKKYCAHHFTCSLCEKQFNEKSKFFDADATPVCKQCYGKLRADVRKSLQQHRKKRSTSMTFKQSSV